MKIYSGFLERQRVSSEDVRWLNLAAICEVIDKGEIIMEEITLLLSRSQSSANSSLQYASAILINRLYISI